MMREAVWLWLPLFLAVCLALGFYRSFVDPGASASGSTRCPQGSQLDQLLGCR